MDRSGARREPPRGQPLGEAAQPSVVLDRGVVAIVDEPRQQERVRRRGGEAGLARRRRDYTFLLEPRKEARIGGAARITEMCRCFPGEALDALPVVGDLPSIEAFVERGAMPVRVQLDAEAAARRLTDLVR